MQERIITLDGSVNLRDFGGYPTMDGKTVRKGKLYRSGLLSRLSTSAQQAFGVLGIGTICDLRRAEEIQSEPTPFPKHAPKRLEIPVSPGSAGMLYQELKQGQGNTEISFTIMKNLNRELALDHGADYARMFDGLLAVGEQGFLIHCSAGKDRTGFACALILHLLGVDREIVLEDYLLTNVSLDDTFVMQLIERFGSTQATSHEFIREIASVRPEYLHAAYQAIEERFDTVENYIEQEIGITATVKNTLRSRLLE